MTGREVPARDVPPAPPSSADLAHLRAALALAVRGPLGDPNPRVGAIVTDARGAVVGQGFHAGAGTAHAEVVALSEAGDRARGGTAYVTLEPCAHMGRTGPCVDALLASGITRVVYAQADATPAAAGGAELLRTAGVDVVGGVLAGEAAALNAAWTFAHRHGRPMVTWKLATTLDGRAAATDGTSRWISGEAARADVHDLRAACDAVLVGTGTALADDASLTVRHQDGSLRARQPLRVVMGHRSLPAGARLLDESAPTLHLTTHDPHVALEALWGKGVRHVLLEGGPTLAAAFLRAGVVDEVVAYVAPVLLGAGRPTIADLGITTIESALRLEPVDIAVLGADVRIRARVAMASPRTPPPATRPTPPEETR